MKLTDIKAAVHNVLGIDTYNTMQTAVAVSDSRRIVLLSPTGSGKTVAFATALLRRLPDKKEKNDTLRSIVVAPSRELVRQIFDVVRPLAATFGLKTLAVYGGNSFSSEQASIEGALPDIIIATPGRLLDHIHRGTLDVSLVRNVVLDEYDKILELGFQDEMQEIARLSGNRLPGACPDFVMLTSATPMKDVPDFIDIQNAETIDYTAQSPVSFRLRIMTVPSPDRDKLATLGALIRAVADRGPIMVFVNHRESADRVGAYLKSNDISCVVYHGGLDQQHREMALARFDCRGARVIVSTDLAARGLDIDGIATVIHYHPASDIETWTHRNGRTARVERTGDVYVIVGPDEDVPEFVRSDNDYYPDFTDTRGVESEMTAVYFDRGKRDKISKGDIAGFVMKKCGVAPGSVGKITVGNSWSMVAVAPDCVSKILDTARVEKIKNIRVRASVM